MPSSARFKNTILKSGSAAWAQRSASDRPVLSDHTISLGSEHLSARSWTIATGSSAGVPPIEELREIPYLTNREIFSLDKLPASLAIIGGGPIGIELAQAFTRLGSEVAVVELLPMSHGFVYQGAPK